MCGVVGRNVDVRCLCVSFFVCVFAEIRVTRARARAGVDDDGERRSRQRRRARTIAFDEIFVEG